MIDKYGIDELGRPSKDLYFINLCFEVARRSIDPTTKHGCIAVDADGSILSTGYNSAPQGYIDKEFPLTRPEKYVDMVHSEPNCIYMAARHHVSLTGSTFYITGIPCRECLKAMIQVKVAQIVYGPYGSAMLDSKEFIDGIKVLLKGQPIVIRRFIFDEGLYRFNPRVGEIMADRKIGNTDFQWNWSEAGSSPEK
jgi:deoxycytidylate deaminase